MKGIVLVNQDSNMKHLVFIDYVKTLAIFLVIVYHCHVFDGSYLVGSILSLCCPLFFTVNGALLLPKKHNYAYYLPKMGKMLILITIWGGVSNLLAASILGETYSVKKCAIDLYFLRSGFCNHLWFLFTLFILYGLYPLTAVLTENKKTLIISLIVLCTLTLSGISHFLGMINPMKGWHSYALAYAIGGVAILNVKTKSKWIPLLVTIVAIGLQCFANDRGYYTGDMVFSGYKSPFIFIATLSLIKLFSLVELKDNQLISFIARNSLGIYLIHRAFMTTWITQQHISSFFRYTSPILVLLFSCLLCWLFRKFKYTEWLISM